MAGIGEGFIVKDGKVVKKRKGKYRVVDKSKRTSDGIVFDSQMEMRVYDRIKHDIALGEKLLLHSRWPLTVLQPRCGKVASYLSIDFVWMALRTREVPLARCAKPSEVAVARFVDIWVPIKAVDAKPKKRKSREWLRGAAAFEASYGVKIEETDK